MLAHARVLSANDLVIEGQERSKGAGGVLCDRLVDYARARGRRGVSRRHAIANRSTHEDMMEA
jgi:hypothetical protein